MRITSVIAYAIKIPPVSAAALACNRNVEAYGDYTIAADAWTCIYSRSQETCLVRLKTGNWLVGWGEGQAPVSVRATAAIGGDLCTPPLTGRNPLEE